MDQTGNSIAARGSAKDALLGQVIAGKYQVERMLGRGGMGTVYEGKDLMLERTIAIKVMDKDTATDKRATARFLREAKAAARIEHGNAVTIYDFGVWQENIAYIVMEYIRGCSLRDWLNKNVRATPAQTVEWLAQACDAVAAAHDQGVVHRDLKPENIMLKETAEGRPFVKVVDFGLAKMVSAEPGGSSSGHITKTGEVIGTPYYMAPEFYDGEEVDYRADIYALGIIGYEMLSGDAPFTGTVERIIAGHLFNDAQPLTEKEIDVPPALDNAIARAMKKKRAERLPSAQEFALCLRAALSQESALADEPGALNASSGSLAVTSGSLSEMTSPQPAISTLEWVEEERAQRASTKTRETVRMPEDAFSVASSFVVPMQDASSPGTAPIIQVVDTRMLSQHPAARQKLPRAVIALAVLVLLAGGGFIAYKLGTRVDEAAPPVTVQPTPTAAAPVAQPTVTPPQPVIEKPVEQPVPPPKAKANPEPRPKSEITSTPRKNEKSASAKPENDKQEKSVAKNEEKDKKEEKKGSFFKKMNPVRIFKKD